MFVFEASSENGHVGRSCGSGSARSPQGSLLPSHVVCLCLRVRQRLFYQAWWLFCRHVGCAKNHWSYTLLYVLQYVWKQITFQCHDILTLKTQKVVDVKATNKAHAFPPPPRLSLPNLLLADHSEAHRGKYDLTFTAASDSWTPALLMSSHLSTNHLKLNLV